MSPSTHVHKIFCKPARGEAYVLATVDQCDTHDEDACEVECQAIISDHIIKCRNQGTFRCSYWTETLDCDEEGCTVEAA